MKLVMHRFIYENNGCKYVTGVEITACVPAYSPPPPIPGGRLR